MGAVGLLYVGAVLILTGVKLLGWVEAKSAAPLNIFVGGLQVVTPTVLIIQAHGSPAAVEAAIFGASGLYLFGFTYLYVAWNLLAGLDGTGLGWFSLFVAICAVVYAWLSFTRLNDSTFAVIWLNWAFLWLLFFLLLGRNQTGLSRYTGAVAAIQGWVTAAIPAFLLLTGHWGESDTARAIGLAIFAVVVFGVLYPRLRGTPAPAQAEQVDNPQPA